ncbi:uncharacterized protein TNIN_414241 [Trichonephila inaurata madagascariensis]|uniref:Uncharacterized protein n=1 Tax=Trichonephila inaurata madagascariensis TaxID=2747483 RepID=A0A8X7CJR4_9ARAC|nr:uncharacterized protein TNIN_414241 [Trichonephila inaurata madagascariensis]
MSGDTIRKQCLKLPNGLPTKTGCCAGKCAIVILYFSGFVLSFVCGQNVADDKTLSGANHEDNGYLFRYDRIGRRGSPKNSPFHDIFTVKQLTGETQRVHYAVDDHGIRANLNSNSVLFGKNIDTSTIHFGSRLREPPANNFNSVLQNVLGNVPVPQPAVVNAERRPPELELPPAFVPLRPSAQNFGLNVRNGDINEVQKSTEEPLPPPQPVFYDPEPILPPTQPVSYDPEPSLPPNPMDLKYEPQRIAKPNTPSAVLVPTAPTENLPLNIRNDKKPNESSPKGKSLDSQSKGPKVNSGVPGDLLPLPKYSVPPQPYGYGLRQDQISNTAGLQWYQSFPPLYPPIDPVYNLPFYPPSNAYESQRIGEQDQFSSYPQSNNSPSKPFGINAPKSNIKSVNTPFDGPVKSSGPKLPSQPQNQEFPRKSDRYLEADVLKSTPNPFSIPNSEIKLTSNSFNEPAKSPATDVSLQSQRYEFQPKLDPHFGADNFEIASNAFKDINSNIKSVYNSFNGPTNTLGPKASSNSQKPGLQMKSYQTFDSETVQNPSNTFNGLDSGSKTVFSAPNTQVKSLEENSPPSPQILKPYLQSDQYQGPQETAFSSFAKQSNQFIRSDFAAKKTSGNTLNTNVDISKFQIGSTKQPMIQYPLRHNFPVHSKSDHSVFNEKNYLQNSKSLNSLPFSKDSERYISNVQLGSTKQPLINNPTPISFPVTSKSEVSPVLKNNIISSKTVTFSPLPKDVSLPVTKISPRQPTSHNLFPMNSKSSKAQVNKNAGALPVAKSQALPVPKTPNTVISKPQLFSTSQSPILGQALTPISSKNKLDIAQQIKKDGPSIVSKSLISPSMLKNKNAIISTIKPLVLSSAQKLFSNNNKKTEIIPMNKKINPFPQSKPLISSPMATIFDTAKENGQYYHYILNGTRPRQPIDNLKQLMEKVNRFNVDDNQKQTKQAPPVEEKEKISIPTSSIDTKIFSGEVTDIFPKSEDIPAVTLPYIIFEIDDHQSPNGVVNEIAKIVDTEEPLTSTSVSNDLVKEILTSAKPASEESTTSSFLTELFDTTTVDGTPTTEKSTSEIEKFVTEEKENEKELTSLFITVPETSLSSLFSENVREINGREREGTTSDVSLYTEKTTTTSEPYLDITTIDELKEYLDLTPTTTSSYETSTINSELNTIREPSSVFEISTATPSPQSTISSTEKYEDSDESVTTTLSPSTTESTSVTTIGSISTLSTTATSSENTETITEITDGPNDFIVVDVINTDSSITGSETSGTTEFANEQETKTESAEQQKPMLELVIQNTEMNDFMSRINNMPIMIRVVNPMTTMSPIPTTTETTTTEEGSTVNNDIPWTTESSKENTDDSSKFTEVTSESLISSTVAYLEDTAEDTSPSTIATITTFEKIENEEKQQTNTVSSTLKTGKQSNFIDSTTTLKSEPNSKEASLSVTEVMPSTSKSITEPQSTSNTMEQQKTSTLTKEENDIETTSTETPDTIQYTLVNPVDSTIFDRTSLNHEKIIDYATKLAESLGNLHHTEEPEDYHDGEGTVFVTTEGDSTPTIESTGATEPLHVIPVFFESDEARAPEESQNIANFKTFGNQYGTNNPLTRQNQFNSFPKITNFTSLKSEKVANYKSYEKLSSPVDYVDFASYKDIDYNSQISVGDDSKFPSEAFYVLDDYDILPSNPVDQQGDYILVGGNGNFDSNGLPANIMESSNLNGRPVYIIDGSLPKFGRRFQQDPTIIDLSQQKVKAFQEPIPRDFQSFRSSNVYDIKPKLSQDQWYPSKQ